MSIEDVSNLLPGEGQEQHEPQPEPQPIEQPVETVTFKVRGEERQIPTDRLDSLAESMGTTRETALMWLQTGKDAGSHYQEQRQREREIAQREAEVNALYQRMEQERQQRSGYSQPTHQPQMQPNGLPEDPVELLRWQAARMQQLEQTVSTSFQKFEQMQQAYQQREQQELQRRESQAIESAFTAMVDAKKRAGLPVPDWDAIQNEAIESGLASNRALSWDKVLDRAYKNIYFDEYGRHVERRAMEKLRDPKATVTITGGGSPAPRPAAAPNAENMLGNMTVSQARELFPEAR